MDNDIFCNLNLDEYMLLNAYILIRGRGRAGGAGPNSLTDYPWGQNKKNGAGGPDQFFSDFFGPGRFGLLLRFSGRAGRTGLDFKKAGRPGPLFDKHSIFSIISTQF